MTQNDEFSIKEAAERLGIAEDKLTVYAVRGLIPSRLEKGELRISQAVLLAIQSEGRGITRIGVAVI